MIGSPHTSNTAGKERKSAIIYQIKMLLDAVFVKDQFLVLCFPCCMSPISATDARINLGFTSLQMTPTFCMPTKFERS